MENTQKDSLKQLLEFKNKSFACCLEFVKTIKTLAEDIGLEDTTDKTRAVVGAMQDNLAGMLLLIEMGEENGES